MLSEGCVEGKDGTKEEVKRTNDPWRLPVEVTCRTDLNAYLETGEIWKCLQISQLASVLSRDQLSPHTEALSIFHSPAQALRLCLRKMETLMENRVPHFQPGTPIPASRCSAGSHSRTEPFGEVPAVRSRLSG